jgi:hypothetical protein
MPKTNAEDTTDIAEETLLEPEAVPEAEEVEEVVPQDDEKAPIKKKVAALKARHRLEDYFEMKRIQDELDYLDDEKKRKAALLLKVAQEEKLDKHKELKEPKVAKPKVTVEIKPKLEKPVKPEKVVKAVKAAKQTKVKAKPKAKPKPKPKKKAKK